MERTRKEEEVGGGQGGGWVNRIEKRKHDVGYEICSSSISLDEIYYLQYTYFSHKYIRSSKLNACTARAHSTHLCIWNKIGKTCAQYE